MKFTFIANACGIFTGSDGTRILCDPWIQDGVFEGSWCHYPPLSTTLEDFAQIDAIYVSHIHPDHFDERTFNFPMDIPILVLDNSPNFLIRRLEELGYSNLFKVRNGETITFREYNLTLYAPFVTHNFHDAKVGNLIDSALVLQDNLHRVLNANDNTPDIAAVKDLNDRFGQFDLVMLNYNAAGPYPSCFLNLSETDLQSEHERILQRNFDYMAMLAAEFSARCILPFAGAYVIGGQQWKKNRFLGTTTWDRCKLELQSRLPEVNVQVMREGQTLDLTSMDLDGEYVSIDPVHMSRYIEKELVHISYPFELDEIPDLSKLAADLNVASDRAKLRSAKYGLTTSFDVFIELQGHLQKVIGKDYLHDVQDREENRFLICKIDLRLLRRILDRRAHWNNAEIGCHIDFYRSPNIYEPDLHSMLQFLHL